MQSRAHVNTGTMAHPLCLCIRRYYRQGAGKTLLNHVPWPCNADDKYRSEHIPFKKGAHWKDLGELSKDGRSTVRPFKWYAEKDNNVHGEKLPPGDGAPQLSVPSHVSRAADRRPPWDAQ